MPRLLGLERAVGDPEALRPPHPQHPLALKQKRSREKPRQPVEAQTYTSALASCASRPPVAAGLLRRMEREELRPNAVGYGKLLEGHSSVGRRPKRLSRSKALR